MFCSVLSSAEASKIKEDLRSGSFLDSQDIKIVFSFSRLQFYF